INRRLRDALRRSVSAQGLDRPGARLLVACSGGADSVALARLLIEAATGRWTVGLAHVNHGLRGAASDRDAAFVRALALRHGLDYLTAAVDVRALMRRRKPGLEAAS